jgi:diguanylate cyclase (GGDEF)-like protein/PAS domain S-box-containing protein
MGPCRQFQAGVAGSKTPEGAPSRDLLSVLLQTSDRAIVSTNIDGVVTRWNQAAEAMLGYSASEAVGRHGAMLAVPGREADLASILDRALQAHDVPQHGTQLRHKDGRLVEVVLAAYPIANERGETIGTVEIIWEPAKQAEPRVEFGPQHFEHVSQYDSLTGLPNRALTLKQANQAVAECRRHGYKLFVLLVDLDGLARINDTLGHTIGDALLRALADRLRSYQRDGGTIGRIGGDEFVVLHRAAAGTTQVEALAQDILRALIRPYEVGGYRLTVNASIGVSSLDSEDGDVEQLLRNAKTAASRARNDGTASVRFYESSMHEDITAKKALELSLRNALARREFEVHYQPFADTRTERVRGFEALVRWRSPEKGMISPSIFMPLAEETGLIVPLGEWILRKACEDAANWPPYISVAVNVSASQCGDALVQIVVNALATSRLTSDRLELEITESALLQENSATLSTLHKLRALGVRIAMDDFGTGYSSLSYLRSFPFDKIKIDQSFVRDLGANPDCLTIVRAVAGLGASFGVPTTAEGVETKEQLEQVRDAGCTYGQGYYFGRSTPAEEVRKSLQHRRELVRKTGYA